MKKKRHIYGMILGVAVLVVCSMNTFAKTEKEEAESQKEQMQNKLEAVREKTDVMESQEAALEEKITTLDGELTTITEDLNNVELELEKKEETILKAGNALEKAKGKEQKQYEDMKLRIRYMYENGSSEYAAMLLSAESMPELLNKAEYISEISEYDRNMLEKYSEVKKEIAKQEKELKTEYEEKETLLKKTEESKQQMQSVLDEKQEELLGVHQEIVSTKDLEATYEAEVEAQNQILEEIARKEEIRKEEARKAAEEAAQKEESEKVIPETEEPESKDYFWPCPSSYTISSEYGYREAPTQGATSYHEGLDIAANSGESIVAAASGTVVISQYSVSAGNYITISHGNGLYTTYMHASALYVAEGEYVNGGQSIAAIGSTGYSTGPHLHFAVVDNGAYVNPHDYVG